MLRAIRQLFRKHEDHGQDLAEYCLITALIALVAAGILFHMSGGMQGLWNSATTSLASGNATTNSAASNAVSSTPANSH
jgi:Flp pilus assembly pilin Flp